MVSDVKSRGGFFRILRIVFVGGMALFIVQYFVLFYQPSGEVLKLWLASGGSERHLSSFDLCRLLNSLHSPQGIFYMALTGFELVIVYLAIQRPRRWVFITGASEQLLLLVLFLVRPASNDLTNPLIALFLGYLSWTMCLTGFFVKPPRTRLITIIHTDRLVQSHR
jgi:hypothetical protein